MSWKPDYIDADDLGDYLRIGDDADDVLLAIAATTASRIVDGHCNRQFGNVAAEARSYTAWYDYERRLWVVDIDDLADDDPTVTVAGETVTGWELEPANAVAEGKVWTRLTLPWSALTRQPGYKVDVIAPWGWPSVPTSVVQASLLQGSRLNVRRNSPFGIAGSPDQGSEMRLLARVDPDVKVALTGYRRPRKAG